MVKTVSQNDKNNLDKLITIVLTNYSKNFSIPVTNITPHVKNSLFSIAFMFYSYLTKDMTEEEKLNLPNSILFEATSFTLKCHLSQSENRYRDYTTVSQSTNADLFCVFETSLDFLVEVCKPLSKSNPLQTLLPDLFLKFFSQAYGIFRMLSLNLPSEAYSIWRTLHEAECVIKLLNEGGVDLQNVYLRHLVYNNAFRHAIQDKDETDKIFAELKSNMAAHNLKSKDMKKYIEYGWLYSCKDYHEDDVSYKLNFRDGLQKAASLGEYNQWYETASELIHSSPIFFYSNNAFFMDLTSLNLGDSLLRVIEQFELFCKKMNLPLDTTFPIKKPIFYSLQKEVKAFDEMFNEKYKDFLIDEDEEDNDEREDI